MNKEDPTTNANDADVPQVTINRPGYDALWGWFGLSYASWLTLPRVLMHAMSDEWQQKMADLLIEYQETFTNMPSLGTRVQITTESGVLTKTPDWLIHYRYPNVEVIDVLKGLSLLKVLGNGERFFKSVELGKDDVVLTPVRDKNPDAAKTKMEEAMLRAQQDADK